MSEQALTTGAPAPAPSLSDLARRINAEHTAVIDAVRRGALHAIEAGKLLLQAQALVPFGEWLDWLPVNTKFSERTAQIYMQLAQGEHLLLANPNNSADLSVNRALKLLTELKHPELKLGGGGGGRRGSKRDPVAEA